MIYSQEMGRPLTNDEIDFNTEQAILRGSLIPGADMSSVILRRNMPRPLTVAEMDNNFQSIDRALDVALYGDGPYPVLDAVFQGASLLDPRIDFERTGESTYEVGGIEKTAGENVPVFLSDGWRVEVDPLLHQGSPDSGNIQSPLFPLATGTIILSFIPQSDGALLRTAPQVMEIRSSGNRAAALTPAGGSITGLDVVHGQPVSAAVTWGGGSAYIHLDSGKFGPYSLAEIDDLIIGWSGTFIFRGLRIFTTVLSDDRISALAFGYQTLETAITDDAGNTVTTDDGTIITT